MIDALLLALTFALGAVLARVSLCAVAGVQRAMGARDYSGLQRLVLAASGALARLNLHANTVLERATGLNRLHILSEGLGVSVTESLTLGVAVQHYYSAAMGVFAQQCLFSFDWNLGKPKDWFRKR